MDKRPEVQAQRGPHHGHCESKINKASGNQMYSSCNKSTYADYPENAIERSSIFSASAAVMLDKFIDGKLKTMSEASLQTGPSQVSGENGLYENVALYKREKPKLAVNQVPTIQPSREHCCSREAKSFTKVCQGVGHDNHVQFMASQFEKNIQKSKAQRETERGRQKECERPHKSWGEAGKQGHWKHSTNKWNPVDGQSQEKGHKRAGNTKVPEDDNVIECSVYKSGAPCSCGYNQERENPTNPKISQVMAPQVQHNQNGHNLGTAKILEDCFLSHIRSCTACNCVNLSLKMPLMDLFHESKGPQKKKAQETLALGNWGAPNPCQSLQKVEPTSTHHQVRPS
ncbi:hypothetical protein NDU88_004341 [Pleurodeles waltl]|uniref:Uncharacterized protein n=1 Tax=Pleurodeles waltl TaxID=8319 RepID=A0AAV7V1J0_PLEWA|nr:hypothetical protein NDU88_004341 [Pleurodeles waltl]